MKKIFELGLNIKNKFNEFAQQPKVKELLSFKGVFRVAVDTIKDLKKPSEYLKIVPAIMILGGLPLYVIYRFKRTFDILEAANNNNANSNIKNELVIDVVNK